jgi:hypothetical protein
MPRFVNSPLRKKRNTRRSRRNNKRINTRKQRGGRGGGGGLGGASYHGAFTTGASQVAAQLNPDDYD